MTPKSAPVTYRYFSTSIYRYEDEVEFESFSIGDFKFEPGKNVLRDIVMFQQLARYWRSQKELRYRDWDGSWNGRDSSEFQPYIYVEGKRIPVDHFGVEYNGTRIRLDFTGFGRFLKVTGRWRYTRTPGSYKAFRLFASALRQAALRKIA
jgi:hypothetical protein